MTNGPPNGGSDAMCMAADSVCKSQGHPGDLFMQHWRQQITRRSAPGNTSKCLPRRRRPGRASAGTTVEQLLDQAYAAAPKPTAVVQPGTRSYVNLPNNYYADAPTQTIPVVVLGQTIPVTFTVTDVRWDFGDGGSATARASRTPRSTSPGRSSTGTPPRAIMTSPPPA